MGIERISPAARCLRPRTWRAVPWSVQSRPARGLGADQVDPSPAAGRQVAVRFAQDDGFRRPQRGVVEAPAERLKMLPAGALGADGGQQHAGLGGAGHDAAVDGFGDLGGFPLDAVDRVDIQQPLFDGVANRVVKHRAFAPLGGSRSGLTPLGAGARTEHGPHHTRVIQRGDRLRSGGDPPERGGDGVRWDEVAGPGIERPGEQRAAAQRGRARHGGG